MCTNIPVNLPTVVSFLMLYSLRCGCIIILLHTTVRVLFFLVFFMITMSEVYLPKRPPLGYMFNPKPKPPAVEELYFIVFYAYILMIITQVMLWVYCIYLAIGLYYDSAGRIKQYLICRFCTWLMEVIILVWLSIAHSGLILWYLVFLMVVILEFYSFIVVYSYYVDMTIGDDYKEDNLFCDPGNTRMVDGRICDTRMVELQMADGRTCEPRVCANQPIEPRNNNQGRNGCSNDPVNYNF